MDQESEACDLYEDLLRKLLDQPQEFSGESLELITNIYSGAPTISDIETALLASSSCTNNTQDFSSLARIANMERGVSRVENKYILKIKSNGNVLADDGYKWRKYGQKSIKNSPNPRNYYKCTNQRCGAKKQVERSSDDPETLIITYEGLHLHYMYPYFIFGQPENVDPPTKKFRKHKCDMVMSDERGLTNDSGEGIIRNGGLDQPSTILVDQEPRVEPSSQGLLEDMVPLLVRNPIESSKSCASWSHLSSEALPNSCSWSPKF